MHYQWKNEWEPLVCQFAAETGALDVSLQTQKKEMTATLLYHMIRVDIVYTAKKRWCAPSALFARVFFRKNSAVYFYLPEIFSVREIDDYRVCFFGNIENPARLSACFSALSRILTDYLPIFEQLSADDAFCVALKTSRERNLLSYFSLKPSDMPKDPTERNAYASFLFRHYEAMMISRFTLYKGYLQLTGGEYDAGKALYRKSGKKVFFPQEERLLAHAPANYPFTPESTVTYKTAAYHKTSEKNLLWGVLSALLLFVAGCAIFCPLVALINLFIATGTQHTFALPWYGGMLFAGLPVVFGAVALRIPLARLLRGKSASAFIDFDNIENSKAFNIVCYVIFSLALAGSVFLCLCLPHSCIKLYADHLTYNESLIPAYHSYSYSSIKAVYYAKGTFNDYQEFIDRPSYVIQMCDGTLLNFDGYTSCADTETYALPLLDPYVDTVKTVDAIQHIPKP